MRAIEIMPIMVSFCLILGCDAAEPEPPPLEDVAAEDEEAEEAEEDFEERSLLLCNDDCICPPATRCWDGICTSYARFGPIPIHLSACVDDCQCLAGTFCDNAFGSYGYCQSQTPSCSLSFDAAVVQPGATTNLTVTSELMPAGSFSLLYGTKDGVPDENGSMYNLTSGSFPIVNSPGLAGVYTRSAVMYGPQNQPLCWTDTVMVEFLP